VIITLGQSEPANHGRGLYSVTHSTKVQNLNVYDGLIYQLVEPVLGPTFTINGFNGWNNGYGSYMGALGDALINANLYDRVIIEPIAIGGVPAIDYTQSGIYRHWLHAALLRIRAYYSLAGGTNLDVMILWHQGETDGLTVALSGVETSTANYIAYVQDTINFTHNFGFTGKWFIPYATWVGSNPGDHTVARIRDAQAALVNNSAKVLPAPTSTRSAHHIATMGCTSAWRAAASARSPRCGQLRLPRPPRWDRS
jgi:hypothetical protein